MRKISQTVGNTATTYYCGCVLVQLTPNNLLSCHIVSYLTFVTNIAKLLPFTGKKASYRQRRASAGTLGARLDLERHGSISNVTKHWTRQNIHSVQSFLADRTNGRLCYCVASVSRRLSSVTLCIVTKRCVLEQKLLLTAYRKSYMRNRLVPK